MYRKADQQDQVGIKAVVLKVKFQKLCENLNIFIGSLSENTEAFILKNPTLTLRLCCSPAVEARGPQVALQLLLAPLAGLHVEVLEDVVFALGADLSRRHLQRVVVQRDALQVPQVAVAQRHVGDAVAGHVEPDERELGYFCAGTEGRR